MHADGAIERWNGIMSNLKVMRSDGTTNFRTAGIICHRVEGKAVLDDRRPTVIMMAIPSAKD